ncbi:MAG: putative toxin-antitoxin system toxin component, PIN family [Nitrososphaerales archaeon]
MASVVIDTNVLVSALIGHGRPRRLVTKLFEEHTIVSSKEMLAELADVLSREKFADVRSSQVDEFLSILLGKSVLVTIREPLKVDARDPDDDMVLSAACEGKAQYIVSGDNHLLNLKHFRVKIITVREMLEILSHDRSKRG